MATDPLVGTQGRDLIDYVRRLEQRVSELERGLNKPGGPIPNGSVISGKTSTGVTVFRLGHLSSVDDGLEIFDPANGKLVAALGKIGSDRGLVIYDTSGNKVAVVGTNDLNEVGIDVSDPGTGVRLLKTVASLGLASPVGASTASWQRDGDFITKTTGSFDRCYLAQFELITGKELKFRVDLETDVGTTGEVEVRINGSALGTVKTLASGFNQNVQFAASIPLAIGTAGVQLEINARRTGGAGNVYVTMPYDLVMGSYLGATANGWL